nr:hypothetical protein [Tanacetum cinerariifolium]
AGRLLRIWISHDGRSMGRSALMTKGKYGIDGDVAYDNGSGSLISAGVSCGAAISSATPTSGIAPMTDTFPEGGIQVPLGDFSIVDGVPEDSVAASGSSMSITLLVVAFKSGTL